MKNVDFNLISLFLKTIAYKHNIIINRLGKLTLHSAQVLNFLFLFTFILTQCNKLNFHIIIGIQFKNNVLITLMFW